ncbi:unnamed protein product [Choristocarpus tenellus]
MGKKGGSGTNSKVAAAREHQESLAVVRAGKAAIAREAEETKEWKKGSNTRGSAREEEANEKQAEKLAKAAQKKALQEAEESELKGLKTVVKKPKSKEIPPWEAALASSAGGSKKDQKRAEAAKRQAAAEEARKVRAEKAEAEAKVLRDAGITMVDSEMPMESNPNRRAEEGDDFAWASGIDAALDVLSMGDEVGGAGGDRHPEKRLKAAYMAFEEKELVELRVEKPMLKLRQYKQIIFEKVGEPHWELERGLGLSCLVW